MSHTHITEAGSIYNKQEKHGKYNFVITTYINGGINVAPVGSLNCLSTIIIRIEGSGCGGSGGGQI